MPSEHASVGQGAALAAPLGLLGDINNDGIVDIRDYGIWRQQFGATDCGNAADLDGDCIVDIRDYGIWRQNSARRADGDSDPDRDAHPDRDPDRHATPTATPTLPGRAYVTNMVATT